MDLTTWKKDWAMMDIFFNNDEIASIKSRLGGLKVKNVVYCSLESRFAKSGGLAAVAVNILPYLKEVNKLSTVILMTPFYPKIINESKLKQTGISFDVPYGDSPVKAELYKYENDYKKPNEGHLTEYYIKADGFFESEGDPYVYFRDDPKRNEAALIESSLFFCKAAPVALKALGVVEDVVFHLQEWQTALISLTSKEAMLNNTLKSCGTAQTMHNPYDAHIPRAALEKIIDAPRRKGLDIGNGLNAYWVGLQLVDAPMTTVSENFAKEFTGDILQRDYFAPHLQGIFSKTGVYGINNGMFIDFCDEFPKREKHTIAQIKKIKLKNRKALLKILDEFKPKERFGELTYKGGLIANLPDNIPVFVMSGRLDPNQKGYDIFLQAIEKFSQDEIKVILTPMPIRDSDLDYFHEVARKYSGNVTVFPGRMEQGFKELQAGSTYGVMPSVYEPFGAAVEYMANGTVNIARGTGGLVDQIDADKCGLLYREPADYCTLDNIRDFIAASDIAQCRKKNLWAQDMADELHKVLRHALDLYKNREDDYYTLVLNGFKKAANFNWDGNARKYFEIYEKVRNCN